MRKYGQKNGIHFKVYAGTTGVLMAFNIDDQVKTNLLGFAIKRKKEDGEWKWIQGMLQFNPVDKYVPIDTNLAPIQKFRWSDYAVYPKTKYKYKVYAVQGTPDNLEYLEGPQLDVRTESLDTGSHQIIFNRAVAASQAYSRRFGNTNPDDQNDPRHLAARNWLSRGMTEKIEEFINKAKDGNYALEVAIYEFELEMYTKALLAALQRGVDVRVVYHAKKNDDQTVVNERFLEPLPDEILHGRVTTAIFHQKFIVLKKKDKKGVFQPNYVLTGTANFTPNGLWRQANVVHIVRSVDLGRKYSALFNQLFLSEGRGDTKKYINANKYPVGTKRKFSYFSPRSSYDDIEFLVETIKNARSEVFICSTFKMHDDVTTQLANPAPGNIHYGLQNSRTKITGLHRNSSFTVPSYLKKGLEGFLWESTKGQKGAIYVHLKTLIIDFTSNNPTVIVGSHNFSRAASDKNDENFMVIRDNPDVADTYFCEMMRLYDHYRFRYNTRSNKHSNNNSRNSFRKRLTLAHDNSWIKDYFDPDKLKFQERIRFAKKM